MDKRFINFQPKLWYLSEIIVALRLQYLYGNTLVNCLVGMDKKLIKLRPNCVLLFSRVLGQDHFQKVTPYASRRTKFALVKSLDFSEFSS